MASPSAHGQAITITATKIVKPNSTLSLAINIHPSAESTPNPITIGTNMPEILSASLAIGALDPWASSTRRMICAKAVSLPTLVALKCTAPLMFIEAPVTLSPMVFSTGRLSPVSMDSSTLLDPSTRTPSTGKLSPGRTTTSSPTKTWLASISTSRPLRITRAFLGESAISFWIASEVLPVARASMNLPSVMSVSTTAADSK